MYANRELFESQGKFMEIDFGDGADSLGTTTAGEPAVILEPQPSQFITIDFDDVDEAELKKSPSVVGQQPLPSKFITIDFDAIETTKVEPTKEGAQIEVEKKGFIEIDFGSGEEEKKVTNTTVYQPETKTFRELEYGETNLVQAQVQVYEKERAAAPAPRGPEPRGPRPANTVLFFVPGTKKGLLIYNQSPTGPEAKFAGYLPEGTFHASGMEVVDFDPEKHGEEFDYINTSNGAYIQQVVMVDERTMVKLALQGIYQQSPEAEHRRHLFVINIHDEERNVRRELIQATYEEDDMPDKQREIFGVIREVGKTEQGKLTIGDIITESFSKRVS